MQNVIYFSILNSLFCILYSISSLFCFPFLLIMKYARSGLDGRRPLGAGGKSGLHRTGWWVTPTGREVRESATESTPPFGSVEG